MGSGMPEIGSRISLISKADIRYEGKLFAVDPDECTIALSSVRSYGTEDRKTTYPVPAQNQVYDFILFRGSDIKDIRVLTTTIPNDPAIVQLSVPPTLRSGVESHFEAGESEFRLPGSASGSSRMPNAPGASSRPSQTFQNSGFKSASAFSNIDQVMIKHSVQNAVSEDESRSSTPSALNAKSTDAPARTSVSSTKSDEQLPSQQQRKQQPYGNRDMMRSQPQHQNNRYQQDGKPQYQQRYQQNRYPQQQLQQQNQNQRYQQQSQYRDYNNRDSQYNNRDSQYNNRNSQYNNRDSQYSNRGSQYSNRDGQYSNRDNQYNNRDNQYRNYYNDYRDSYGQRQYMQPLRGNVQRSDNWNNYGHSRMNVRPGQVGGNQQNNYQSAGGYQNNPNRRPRNTLKFDDDYDFEQANSQFEEMRSQLAKTKIDDSEGEGPKMNGDVVVEASKKEDSGNEVSGGEENDQEGGEKAHCYDKVKSFFDQISYEAIERSKGLTARMDWKTERKINSETFGQVALRRNANFRRRMNNGGQGGNGYYNNYSNNRNVGMQNNYRSGGYNNNNRAHVNKPRRQYDNPTRNPEESKENEVVA